MTCAGSCWTGRVLEPGADPVGVDVVEAVRDREGLLRDITGCNGQRGVPEAYRASPTLQKPFQVEALAQALEAATLKAASGDLEGTKKIVDAVLAQPHPPPELCP